MHMLVDGNAKGTMARAVDMGTCVEKSDITRSNIKHPVTMSQKIDKVRTR